MSIYVGINCSGFHSSVCVIKNGKIYRAITEERLSRIKNDKSFPIRALKYCTEDLDLNDISTLFIGWNPAKYFHKSDNSLLDAMQNRGKLAYLTINELAAEFFGKNLAITQEIEDLDKKWKVKYVDHHLAHLYNGFGNSGFEKSDFLILDGFGESSTGILGEVSKGSYPSIYNEIPSPHSIGQFYATFTQFLGFRPNSDEWKVMALASLGDPLKYYKKIKSLVKVNGLNLEFDLSYFEHFLFFTPNFYSKKFIEEFGQPALSDLEKLPNQQYYYDLVASAQKVCEDVCWELLSNLKSRTNGENLILGGGFFMNSLLNGKILENTHYKNIFIGGSPDDTGISVGSALFGLLCDSNFNEFNPRLKDNYFGKEYSQKSIINELEKRKLKFKKLDSPADYAAELISKGEIIAWFQGGSEFGQRALGNRSILADPRFSHMKDLVNATIKYREGFRPFAPSVLRENQEEIFFSNTGNSYFMEKVFKVNSEWVEKIPAVVHFDYTGRVQTVNKEINPKYHQLISRFGDLTGCPVVLNTSFNINGMPLVESPSDAIDCFYKSGLDSLIIENFLVKKSWE